jgi:hypothetical protein
MARVNCHHRVNLKSLIIIPQWMFRGNNNKNKIRNHLTSYNIVLMKRIDHKFSVKRIYLRLYFKKSKIKT